MDTPQPSHAETPPATTPASPPRRVPRVAIVATAAFSVLFAAMVFGADWMAPAVAVIAEQVEVGLGLDILPGETEAEKAKDDK